MDRIEAFKSDLMRLCRKYVRGGVNGPRRVTLHTLPWLTAKTFMGTPLRHVMSPLVPDTGIETEAIFDAWLWPKFTEEGDSVEDLTTASSKALTDFVLLGSDFNEQTVRLLYALGNAEGATLVVDPTAMVVQHGEKAYGIIDRAINSRFCTGMRMDVDHVEWLNRRHKIDFQDAQLCVLWQEAYRRGRGAVDAITALYQGDPNIVWKRLLTTRVKRPPPSKRRFDDWVATLCGPGDSVSRLYVKLVPQWMTATEFGKVICRLCVRKEDPSERVIQGCITRLYAFMYTDVRRHSKSQVADISQ